MSTGQRRRSPGSPSTSNASSSEGEAPLPGHDAKQVLAGCAAAASGGTEALCLSMEALGRAPMTVSSDTVTLQELVRASTAAGDGRVQRVLHHAAATGDITTVREFIDIGADLNAVGVQGATALMFAARHGYLACLQQLLSGGAEMAASSENGTRSLHHAAAFGHAACVRALIKAGADVDAADNDGATALMLASSHNHAESVHELLVGGAALEAACHDGSRALHRAATTGCVKSLWVLIQAGADLDAPRNDGGGGGLRALHLAASGDSEEHFQCLLRLVLSGAALNAVDRVGCTPLHVAAASGDVTAIAELLKHGAALDARTVCGQRPVDLARATGHKEAVRALTVAFEAQQRISSGGASSSGNRLRGGKKRSGESGGMGRGWALMLAVGRRALLTAWLCCLVWRACRLICKKV